MEIAGETEESVVHLLLGSGWNLGPHGRENTALGVGTPPPPVQVPSCFEDAGRLF